MTKNYEDRFPFDQAWHGVLDPSLVDDDVVAAGHQLADAAKQGDWSPSSCRPRAGRSAACPGRAVFILLGDATALQRAEPTWYLVFSV